MPSWVAPTTHAVGDVLTATDWNTAVNDISFLSGTAAATVATNQTTAAGSYVDLGTVGPAVTLTTGANALVVLTAQIQQGTVAGFSYMSFAITGGAAAADTTAVGYQATANNENRNLTCIYPVTGLTPGSNTFTAKYKGSGGTASFANRTIVVIPLP